ncbi:unnamed protein product (macronuclear) [Paramecium tetraurelia]|uniref:Protein kinase domain-containing protein n=1 Tax=Paramecium tetraurelia TaxID=5888 RepID=A0CQC9_PARTE|nr:uncharacterized protein GSPATT00009344001 [Paramecium tetraurelia]CAK72996.1 unnamed protein product [Paramecium tetraurelia]|eukprot:XP_001440393.1 hypothetical protein (macronuclear) [Paramecium tetraurelia strain d4-2]
MQFNLKQNAQQILHFTVIRKHYFIDRFYHLKLEKEFIIMSSENDFKQPKYVLQLTPETEFEWIIRNHQLVGFLFPYRNKLKEFYGNKSHITELKFQLGKILLFKSLLIHYKFLLYLDKGAFGSVSLQFNFTTENKFAIKALTVSSKYLLKQIMNEITILRSLDHPNILKLYEVFKTNSTYSLVTEFIDGKNLKQLSKDWSQMQDNSLLDLLKQLFEGLSFTHKNNIIHRDIKLANLILQNDGVLKIIDFGLACFDGDQLKNHPKCGTPGYCAPEILQNVGNKNQYDSKVDVFSAGCVLYKLLTFKSLFETDSSKEVQKKKKNGSFLIKEQGRLFDLTKILVKQNPLDRPTSTQVLQLIQNMIDDDSFDVKNWYRNTFNCNQTTSIFLSNTPKNGNLSKSLFKTQSTPNSSIQFISNTMNKIIK